MRAAAGPRYEELEFSILVQNVVLTDNPQPVAARFASMYGLTTEAILATPYGLIGAVDAIVDKLIEQRERLGISYHDLRKGYAGVCADRRSAGGRVAVNCIR